MDIQMIIYMLAFFFIYSFLGWILESITKTIIQKSFVNSGFLYGPFCPIYGLAAVGMVILLNSHQSHYFTIFIISFVVFSIWEYFVGWLLEKLFNTKYWDYSSSRFNIKGRVCLLNSLIWGFLGVAFIEIIHPFTVSIISKIPLQAINIVTMVLSIYILIDFFITYSKMRNIDIKLTKFSEITESIKEKLEELKELTGKAGRKAKNSEALQNVIEELKQKQTELKEKIEKQVVRLKKAFPSMKSEKISEFLNKKIDFKKDKGDN